MAPVHPCAQPEWLERPEEAFCEYAKQGVHEVCCELKHMGSRAITIIGRTPDALHSLIGLRSPGTIYTRTGRAFFDDRDTEEAMIDAIRTAMERSGLWAELNTEWIVMDGEMLPWRAKAAGLIDRHYMSVAQAGTLALNNAAAALGQARTRFANNADLDDLSTRIAEPSSASIDSPRRCADTPTTKPRSPMRRSECSRAKARCCASETCIPNGAGLTGW